MSGTITWKPASRSAGTIFDHKRLVSGNPCTSTSGRPLPSTCTSSVTPFVSIFIGSLSSRRGNDLEKLLATRRRHLGLRRAPARAELDHLLEDARCREHVGRQVEHTGDPQECPEDVGVLQRRMLQRLRDLELGIAGVVLLAVDTRIDLGKAVAVERERRAVIRLDGLLGCGVPSGSEG